MRIVTAPCNRAMNKIIIFILSILPLCLSATAERTPFAGLFDNSFLTESFAQDAKNGVILAFDEEKRNSSSSTRSFDLINENFTSPARSNKAVATIGIASLDHLNGFKTSLFGLFSSTKKTAGVDFFNLSFSVDYGHLSWDKVISNTYKAKKIVLLIEDMEFVDNHLAKLEKTLAAADVKMVTYLIPSSNNLAIKNAVTHLKKHEFDLILTVNEFNRSMKFINMARRLGVDVPVLFLSTEPSSKNSKNYSFFPSPYDSRSLIAQQYTKALDLFSGKNKGLIKSFENKLQPSIGSYIGYILARSVIGMGQKVTGEITSENLAGKAVETKTIAFDTLKISFGHNFIDPKDSFRSILLREFD